MQQFFTIFLINLLTSIDNAIVVGGIANRHRNLFAIGAVSSVVITVCRTLFIVGIVSVTKWPGIRFALGFVVLVVALNLANVDLSESREDRAGFWRILVMVVVTDLALSVDNILSISVIPTNVFVVASSIFLSLLPLLLLLPVIVRVMNQVVWLRVLAAGFVAELAVDSMTDDPLLIHRMPTGRYELLLRVSSAAMVILYGIWKSYVYNRNLRSS